MIVSFASDNTHILYEKVLNDFMTYAVAERHYSLPANMDRREWLVSHRARELTSDDPLGCERVASLWFASLEKTLDPLTRATYVAILSRTFALLLPDSFTGYLRLPAEPDELIKPLK